MKLRFLLLAALALPFAASAESITYSNGSGVNMQFVQFTSTGANSWTVPATCNNGAAICTFYIGGTGAGAPGAGGQASASTAGGGGGGAASAIDGGTKGQLYIAAPGTVCTATVAAGAAGAAAGSNSGSGASSTFACTGGPTITIFGGAGGSAGSAGTGGNGSGSSFNVNNMTGINAKSSGTAGAIFNEGSSAGLGVMAGYLDGGQSGPGGNTATTGQAGGFWTGRYTTTGAGAGSGNGAGGGGGSGWWGVGAAGGAVGVAGSNCTAGGAQGYGGGGGGGGANAAGGNGCNGMIMISGFW